MYIVDRLEGAYVICEKEDKTFVDIEKHMFPAGVKPGDVVYEQNGKYLIDIEQTKNRSEKIRKLMDSLWED